jgi:3-oxoadipate enol-lactonase
MPTAAINGTIVHYEDTGGEGPVLLLSHGFLMDHTMFAPQVAALRREFRVVTWDARGFGATPSGGAFSYWDSARDAFGLLDHLGIDGAVFGGMSQGGFVALRAALLMPERVAALVLMDTQSGTEDPALVPQFEAMNAEWDANGPGNVQDLVAAMILGPDVPASPWFDKWATISTEERTNAFRCLMDRDDVTDRLGEITCPVVIFHGDEDIAIPLAKAEQLRDALSGCEQLVVVPGASHAANLSHPDEVNGPLLDFMKRNG